MSKRNTSVVMNKAKLLTPKMEFVVLDSETGEGLFVRELGGKALLDYKEKVIALSPEEGDPSTAQSIELMCELVLQTACNENGSPFFTKKEVDVLASTSIKNLQALALFAMTLSGIGEATNNLKNELNSDSTGS